MISKADSERLPDRYVKVQREERRKRMVNKEKGETEKITAKNHNTYT
jgi:hypothetical protein